MTEKKETYNLNLHCRNCNHNFIQTIPFGLDFKGYIWGGGPAHYGSFNTFTVVPCPKCGSGKVIIKKGEK